MLEQSFGHNPTDTNILFVGREPDRYASLWRQVALRNVSLAFAKSSNAAIRKLGKDFSGAILVDGSSLPVQASTVCRALHRHAPSAIIIGITGDHQEPVALADFQLHPPLKWESLSEVLKQARRQDRRYVLEAGDFRLDWKSHLLVGPQGEKRLTPKLNDLLALLLKHPGEIVSRSTIMQQVWHTTYTADTRTLEVHINWLRRSIEPYPARPSYLVTKRGAGYVLYPEGRPTPTRP